MDLDDSGVYTGRFSVDVRRGAGRWDLGCGTSIIGGFDVTEIRNSSMPGGFENPYLEGEPNGQVEVMFGDGGWYRGAMEDGIIHGEGEYQSGFGDVLKVSV
jgi:hypothetical protein